MTAGLMKELSFNPSAGPTIGIEVELQILNRETLDLGHGAVPILKACEQQGLTNVSAEFMHSMIEIKTGICANANEAYDQLLDSVRKVKIIAASHGFELALSSTHPFNRSNTNVVFPGERYEQFRNRLGWIATQDLIFGLHVHVGVTKEHLVIPLMNLLTQYLPHFLALSSNSPYWQSVDTQMSSFRSALYRLIPHSGVPPYFQDFADFKEFMQVMQATNAMKSLKDVYWDIRPRPDFGTIEIRVFDIPSTLYQAVGLATFARTLVIFLERMMEENPKVALGDIRKQWIATENKWLAMRYGFSGIYISSLSGKRRALALEVQELIEKLIPIAKETGDERFLRLFLPVDKMETGSQRQRRIFQETGRWEAVVQDYMKQLSDELAGARGLIPMSAQSADQTP